MTQSQDTEQSTDVVEPSTETQTEVSRDTLGRFIAGVSGNPQGRIKGSKNRTTLIKQAMEEALTRNLAGAFNTIVDNVIEMALAGDKDMIKLLLADVLREARKPLSEEDEHKGGRTLVVEINQYFGPDSTPEQEASKAIEGKFETVDKS